MEGCFCDACCKDEGRGRRGGGERVGRPWVDEPLMWAGVLC
jgi:hypothetical protein